MKSCEHKQGVTLVEMLIVVAIIAMLAAMVIGIAGRIQIRKGEKLTEETFALLNAALGQFHEYGFRYDEASDYNSFDFPLDCNGFDWNELEATLADALGTPLIIDPNGNGNHDPNYYSGSEALYFLLSRVPDSRATLDEIDSSLITNKGFNRDDMSITVDGRGYPLLRIIDPWGRTLRYDYYDEDDDPPDPEETRTFPLIISAGPDRVFGTDDDITSR